MSGLSGVWLLFRLGRLKTWLAFLLGHGGVRVKPKALGLAGFLTIAVNWGQRRRTPEAIILLLTPLEPLHGDLGLILALRLVYPRARRKQEGHHKDEARERML